MEQKFERLEELIKDDDKIVTIASFARETGISVAESLEIFDKYVEINKVSKGINWSYILNGKKKGENHLSVLLVKKDNLEEQKKLYEKGVSQIIFSIQKSKSIDFNVIALVDSVDSVAKKEFCSGLIIGKNCIKRTLRKKVLPTIPPAKVKGKSTIFTKQNTSAVKPEIAKVENSNGGTNQINKNKNNTQNNIASLFGKASQSKKPDQKEVKPPEKKQTSSGRLSNFFTKQTDKELQNKDIKTETQDRQENKPASNHTNDEILKDLQITKKTPLKKAIQKEQGKTTEIKKQNKRSDLFDSDTDDEILKDLEIKDEKPLEKKKETAKIKPKSTSRQKKKRGVEDVGNDKSVKKRKRIIVEDESDSDNIFGSDKSDNEDLIEKSDDEPEPVKIENKPLPLKTKRRKAVDKMYEDEDGYIVTKTEYVYETPSEDENEPENKISKLEEKPKSKMEKKGSSNSENDISPNKGAKSKNGPNKKAPSRNQPTLMNFFKKK